MALFSCKRNGKMIICHHESVCQEDKRFINHEGFVKIDFEIQKFVQVIIVIFILLFSWIFKVELWTLTIVWLYFMNRQYPTYLNFIERKMRLQLLWDQEKNIDECFRKLVEETTLYIKIEMDDQFVNISMITTQC
jgi:hypothetical protein